MKRIARLIFAIWLSAIATPFQPSVIAAPDSASLDFSILSSFNVDVPPARFDSNGRAMKQPKIKIDFPDNVKAFNNKLVQISGFMLPIEGNYDKGVAKFILMRNPITCCFAGANQITEYIVVTMSGTPAPYVQRNTISVTGKLKVGAEYENGILNSIYQMEGEEALARDM